MSDLFISYSRDDSQFVKDLQAKLQPDGASKLELWIDYEDIPYSTVWWARICQGIESADNVAIVITESSLASEVCNEELEHALKQRKRLIPLLAAEVSETSRAAKLAKRTWKRREKTLAEEQWKYLQALNWVDFTKLAFDDGVRAITTTLEEDVDHKDKHTDLLLRALQWDAKGRDNSFRLKGTEIAEAEAWLSATAGKTPEPTPLHHEYVTASRRAETRQQRNILAGVSTALVVTTILTIISLFLFQDANVQRAEAVSQAATAERRAEESQSLALASSAQLVGGEDPPLALALAVEANTIINPPILAQRVLSDYAYLPNTLLRQFTDPSTVEILDFSPDGSALASGTNRGSVTVWDVASGEPRYRLEGHRAPINDLAFSPDGRWLLTAAGDADVAGELIVWDMDSGALHKRLEGHTESVYGVDFNGDGTQALSGGAGGLILLWDTETWEQVRAFNQGISTVTTVTFLPDGIHFLSTPSLAMSQWSQWDMETGWQVRQFDLPTSGGGIRDLTLSPDAQTAFYMLEFGVEIHAQDLDSGVVAPRFRGHTGVVNRVSLSPDGRRALSGSLDRTAQLWDSATGDLIYTFVAESGVTSTAFSPDGQRVAFGTVAGDIEIWSADLNQNGAVQQRIPFENEVVGEVVVNPDQQRVLTILDRELFELDLQTGERTYFDRGSNRSSIYALASLPDGAQAITADDDDLVTLWDIETKTPIHEITVDTRDFIEVIAVSPDSAWFVSGTDKGEVMRWDMAAFEPVQDFESPFVNLYSLDLSPDGVSLVGGMCAGVAANGVACGSGQVVVWDAASGEIRWQQEAHGGAVNTVAYSPDGQTILSGGADADLILWDAETGALLRRFNGHDLVVRSVTFSADGKRALSASADSTLILWDIASGQPMRRYAGHRGSVISVEFLEGERAALSTSGSLDGLFSTEIVVWRIDQTADELLAWTYANRHVRELTCSERLRYQVEPPCDEAGLFPTRTPYPTPLPPAEQLANR